MRARHRPPRWRTAFTAEALDQVSSTHGNVLKAVSDMLGRTRVVQPNGQTAVLVPPSTPTPQAQTRAAQRGPGGSHL